MFKRFKKPAPVFTTERATHVVKDRYTHNVLLTGTRAECDAYQAVFGICYIEEK